MRWFNVYLQLHLKQENLSVPVLILALLLNVRKVGHVSSTAIMSAVV